MLLLWVVVFGVSLAVLIKSADWFTESAEKLALTARISPFIIGVTIVAIGTSLPELATSLAATFAGVTEIVAANAIGSNIANILLIVGLSAVAARMLVVQRSLIDLDLPLLAMVSALLVLFVIDSHIVLLEGVLLVAAFAVYTGYLVSARRAGEAEQIVEVIPSRRDRRAATGRFRGIDAVLLLAGVVGLWLGADWTIRALLSISELVGLAVSILSLTVLAVGTSLPELAVSVRTAMRRKYEISLGNIFGSNVFNVLIVIGLPALLRPLVVDSQTLLIGLPFLVLVTAIFVISGISQRIHNWEGLMYLLLYTAFIAALVGGIKLFL